MAQGTKAQNSLGGKGSPKFHSPDQAASGDREYYRSLTPQQRLEILFEAVAQAQGDEAEQGLTRVCRVVDVDGLAVNFISEEHLLRNKLASGRPQDTADAEKLK